MPVERDESVTELCRQAVRRLAERLPGTHVSCHLRVGDALRVIASEGDLRLIYEVQREQGSLSWRAIETGEAQLVEDVRRDPDYLTRDGSVRSEVAVPLTGDDAALVLDVEFTGRTFAPEEAEAVQAEAARLESELGG
jgi:hypothetical protein